MKFNFKRIIFRMLAIIFGAFFVWVVASNDSNLLVTSVTLILFIIATLIDTSDGENSLRKDKKLR